MRIFTPHINSPALSVLLEGNPDIEFVFEAHTFHSKLCPHLDWPEGRTYKGGEEEENDFRLCITRRMSSSTYRHNEITIVHFHSQHMCYGKRYILGEYTYEEACRLKSWQEGTQLEEPTRKMLLPIKELLEEIKEK